MPNIIQRRALLKGPLVAPPAGSTLRTGMVAFWELEEASGTRNDSHGTNHLTDNNTVTQAAGKVGNAASFASASSEWLSCADNAALSMEGTDFSIAFWMYGDTVTGFPQVMTKAGGGEEEWIIDLTSSALRFQIAGGGGYDQLTSGFGALSVSTWYFIYCSFEPGADTMRISVNDGAVTSKTNAARNIAAGAAPLGLAAYNNTNHFNGRLDQVGMWKKILTSTEVTALYNGGAGLSYAGTA